jgi:hypothetical protein
MSSSSNSAPDLNLFVIGPDEVWPGPRPRRRKARRSLPRPARGELYLGCIPMSWIERTAPLPGRAWHLACAIWFEASCAGGKPARLSGRTRRRFGLTDPGTCRRALAVLVEAGLVRVETRPGRKPTLMVKANRPATRKRRVS